MGLSIHSDHMRVVRESLSGESLELFITSQVSSASAEARAPVKCSGNPLKIASYGCVNKVATMKVRAYERTE